MPHAIVNSSIRLWPLPLLAGLLPAIGAITAAILSMHSEWIPSCNPLIDGCVSISRAGRHGMANQIFRAFVLPGAVLQALTWWLMSHWLQSLADRSLSSDVKRSFWLSALGLMSGVFLVLYASFLGVEGDVYRWLRRYGTVGYFGGTFVCMLLLLRAVRLPVALPRWQTKTLLALCGSLLVLCICNTGVAPMFDEPLKDRIENVSEWWAGIAFTLAFFLSSFMWKSSDFSSTLGFPLTPGSGPK